MYVITFKFLNGGTGTLTHSDINQIRKWVNIFESPDARKECNIIDLFVTKNDEKIAA